MRIISLFQKLFGEGQVLFDADDRGPGRRLLVLGGTMAVLGISLTAAVGALLVLLAALGAIYYLLTQILGIKLDLDPRTLMQQAQRYASASSAPN